MNYQMLPALAANEYEALKADIAARGLMVPIEKDEHGNTLDGFHREQICKELGLTTYPTVRRLGLSEEEKIHHAIALNLERRHLNADQRRELVLKLKKEHRWSNVKIAEAVGVDETTVRRDLSTSAFAEVDLPDTTIGKDGKERPASRPKSIFAQSEQQAEAALKCVEINGLPNGDSENLTALEIIHDANKTLYANSPNREGDILAAAMQIKAERAAARKARELAKQVEAIDALAGVESTWHATSEQKVIHCHALITDPPYGILKEDWEPKSVEELGEFTREWAGRWNECGADTVCIFWSQRYLFEGRAWFDAAFSNYDFHQILVWHYPNNKSPQSRQGFKQTWEPVFFYRRRGCERQIEVGGGEWGDGLNDFDCHVAAVPQSNFNDAEMKAHPAQKPVSVFRWLINAVTEPGEMIADPFLGSGTSGIAATQLHRLFYGIEINSEYLKLAQGRIATYGKGGGDV